MDYIELECPHCERQLRVSADKAGKRGHCPDCRQVITIPVLALEEEPETSTMNFAEAPTPQPPQPPTTWKDEENWTTPQWGEEPEERIEDPQLPFRDQPDPTAQVARPAPDPFGQQMVMDLARDSNLISYALYWIGLLAVMVCLAGGLAWLVGGLGVIIGGFLLAVSLYLSYIGLVAGVSHMTSHKLLYGYTPDLRETWSLLLNRAVDLTVGTSAVYLLTAVVVALVAGVVSLLSNIPLVGQILGGLLLIPTFLGIIFTFGLVVALSLMPIVISVENCGAFQAFTILRELVTRRLFTVLKMMFSPLLSLIPTLLMVLVLTVFPLAAALSLCSGRVLVDGPGYSTLPLVLSASAIILTAFGYAMVIVFVSFALVYCSLRRQALQFNG